jgi:hypothetical protein
MESVGFAELSDALFQYQFDDKSENEFILTDSRFQPSVSSEYKMMDIKTSRYNIFRKK